MSGNGSSDLFRLDRFVTAQEPVYANVLRELRAGRKTSHWMWFVFPQLAGLGQSATAIYYAIGSLDEARAYFEDPLLGARLRECTSLVLAHPDKPLRQIFGAPDDLKFRSSMTLFAAAAPEEPSFWRALEQFCDGKRDPLTLELLGDGAN